MRIFYCLVFLLIGSFVFTSAQSLTDPETRGVWVTGDYLKGGPEAIELMVRRLSDANFNLIFVDVWYRGYTIYPSSVVSSAGGPLQNPDFAGTDPLRTTIDIAHKYGIQVFAWFEFGLAAGYSSDSTKVPSILKLHPEWMMAQRDTTKRFSRDGYGNYFFWIDPAVTTAADFIADLFTECAKNYPDIDGVELDRMRYPSTSFSYSDTSRFRFMQETNNPDPLTLPDNNTTWASWRCLQVTNVVKKIYKKVKSVNPNCIVTGAVVPPYMMYGGTQDKLQAWDVWAKNSYVDVLEVMLYLPTSAFEYQLNLSKNYVPHGFNLSAGIAINAAGSVTNTISEIQTARTSGMAGEVLWYYGYLLSYPGALPSLKSSVYKTRTTPAYDDLIIDNSMPGLFRTTGNWVTRQGGYKGTFNEGKSEAGDTAIFTVRILRSGKYSLYSYWSGDSISNSGQANILIGTNSFQKLDTVNQKVNLNKWKFVDKFFFSSGDTVTIKLFSTDSGNLIADAFRLKRGSVFAIEDYAMADSQTVLLKFTNSLLNPVSSLTKVSASFKGSDFPGLNFFIDPVDNTVLHITVPPIPKGLTFTLKIDSLLDFSYDTLNVSLNITYKPDSTEFIIDDQTPNSFWKLLGNWFAVNSNSAVGETFWLTKQTVNIARVQWGPHQILENGYYDVFVRIPVSNYLLSDRCLYIVRNHFGTDSIYVSQSSASGTWLKLGNFPYRTGDNFAVLLSSTAGSDTNQYIAADAVMLKRSVEVTSVKDALNSPSNFIIYQNYPNPFNPATTISFSIESEAKVDVTIYNMLGQKVLELVDEKTYQPGIWKVVFDGTFLSSGIYFALVKLRRNTFEGHKTLKLVLVK